MLFLLTATLGLAADVTGKWQFRDVGRAIATTSTMDLKQDGEKVSGTYSGQLGEASVTGTVKGSDIDIVFEASPTGGEKLTVRYTGTLEGDKKITGSVSVGGLGNKGSFTAEKQ